jgi:hypothetical protein
MWAFGGVAPAESSRVAETPGQEARTSKAIRNRRDPVCRSDWMLMAGILESWLIGPDLFAFTIAPQSGQPRIVTTARP